MDFEVAAEFAEFLGITDRRWNNFEVGYPLSRSVARLMIAKIPGLSLDWLEEGRIDGLSIAMARQLGELTTHQPPEPPTARRRRA